MENMTDYENVEAVRALSENELTRLNKTQLTRAVFTLINAECNVFMFFADKLIFYSILIIRISKI